jgi:WD40 repeat protein
MEVEFSVGAWHIPDNGSIAVFGSREGEVIFGNLTEANQEWTYFRTNRRITSIRVNQISSLIACGAQNGEVTIWDMNGELRGRLSTLPVRPITGIGFALSGTTVLIFTEESPPVLWEFGDDFRSPFYTALFRPVSKNQDTDLGLVKKPNRNDRMLDQFAISPDGNLLGIKILSDRTVEFTTVTIIDIRSRRQLAISPFGPDSWATELAFSRDGSVLAYTTRTAVVVWNHVSNRLIGKFSTKYDQYENLTFSPNGKILAAILSGRSIHFWTVEDGVKKVHFQELYQFSRVRNIVFTPDDMLIGVGENWTKSARMCAIYEFPTPIMDGDSAIEKPRQKV